MPRSVVMILKSQWDAERGLRWARGNDGATDGETKEMEGKARCGRRVPGETVIGPLLSRF